MVSRSSFDRISCLYSTAKARLLAIWTAIEPGLGIIVSSLATLRPLVRQGATSSKGNSTEKENFATPKTSSLKDATEETYEFDSEQQEKRVIGKQQDDGTVSPGWIVSNPRPPATRKSDKQTFLNTATIGLSTGFSVAPSSTISSEEENENVRGEELPVRALQMFHEPGHVKPELLESPFTTSTNSAPSPWASYAALSANQPKDNSIPPVLLTRPMNSRERTEAAHSHLLAQPWSQGSGSWNETTNYVRSKARDPRNNSRDARHRREAVPREGLSLGIFSFSGNHSHRTRSRPDSFSSSIIDSFRRK
jgi:hypothetical protein